MRSIFFAAGLWLLGLVGASAQCVGPPGAPFNCKVGTSPQPTDLLYGGSQAALATGNGAGSVSFAIGLLFANAPAIVSPSGTFNTLIVTGSFSGPGLANFLSSPPMIGNVAPNVGFFTNLNASTALALPNWATGGRPSAPVTGTIGWNTSLSAMDEWNGTAWVSGGSGSFSSPPALGNVAPNTVAATTLTASGLATLSGGVSSPDFLQTGIASNAALKALSISGLAAGTSASRLGFYAAGDGGAATYTLSTSACSAPDNGAQVSPTTGTGCWVANFGGTQTTPIIWGASGNGTTNDTTAVQAALTAMAGKTLYTGPYTYCVSPGVTLSAGSSLIDTRGINSIPTSPSLRACAPSVTVLTINSNDLVQGINIDMLTDGSTTTGTGISGRAVNDTLVDHVVVYGGCMGIDIGGNNPRVQNSWIRQQDGLSGCGGIRVGDATTNTGTLDMRLESVEIATANTAAFGLKVEDSGGMFISDTDIIFPNIGTWIVPGAGQVVAYMFATNSALGDTDGVNPNTATGMIIDTSSSTGTVEGLQFNSTWTSNSQVGAGLLIRNTGGGSINGLHFVGHRAYLNRFNGIEIDAPVSGSLTDITFDAISICGQQNGTDLSIGAGLQGVSVRNSRIGTSCDNQTEGTVNPTYGIGIGAGASEIAIMDNDITGSFTSIAGIPSGASIVTNNLGVDTAGATTIASATTITLNQPEPVWHITGATPIVTINDGWMSRQVTFITDTGALAFNTGGNIKSSVTSSGAGAVVNAYYDGTFWYLK